MTLQSPGGFGSLLRELRQAAGLTQAQVAEAVGVSTAYISALENGRKPPPPRAMVSALAACLKVDDKELWAQARAEREARVRQRIQGRPTAFRFLAPLADLGEQPSLEHDLELESCVQALLSALKDAFPDTQRRALFLHAVTLIVKSLQSDLDRHIGTYRS